MEKEIISTQVNGVSSHRETPEKTEIQGSTHEEEEEDEEYEEDSEAASKQGDSGKSRSWTQSFSLSLFGDGPVCRGP